MADLLVERLQARYPGFVAVGTYSPPFRPLTAEEDAAIVERINASGADLVWVGLSTPKQERWMAGHVGRLQASALLGVGAAFDIHAGTLPQAPRWMQERGLEWLYRLVTRTSSTDASLPRQQPTLRRRGHPPAPDPDGAGTSRVPAVILSDPLAGSAASSSTIRDIAIPSPIMLQNQIPPIGFCRYTSKLALTRAAAQYTTTHPMHPTDR